MLIHKPSTFTALTWISYGRRPILEHCFQPLNNVTAGASAACPLHERSQRPRTSPTTNIQKEIRPRRFSHRQRPKRHQTVSWSDIQFGRGGDKVRNLARGEAKNPPALKPCVLLMSIRVTGKPPRSDFLRKSPSKKSVVKGRHWSEHERALCARANLSGVLNRGSDLIGRSCTLYKRSSSVSRAPCLSVSVCSERKGCTEDAD